jgi:hypothetical protein
VPWLARKLLVVGKVDRIALKGGLQTIRIVQKRIPFDHQGEPVEGLAKGLAAGLLSHVLDKPSDLVQHRVSKVGDRLPAPSAC